ncbi:MAG TPA: hypothetical protein VKE69_07575 [Planctomycetota bacterium]|nr:hypothetical protein [Planctomycetota bacterium]
MARAGLSVLLLAVAACATPRPAPPGAPVVVLGEGASAVAESLDRLARASELGDEDRARAEIAALRRARPDDSVLSYLASLESVMDGRALARAVARDARLEPTREEATLGDPLEVRVEIPAPVLGGVAERLEIPQHAGRTRTRCFARVTTTDLDAYGDEVGGTESVEIALPEDVRADPGAPYATTLSLPTPPAPNAAARIVEVEMEILPAAVKLGGRAICVTRLTLPSTSLVALPPGYAAQADDPLAALDRCLRDPSRAADHSILSAVLLLREGERPAALRRLAEGLREASGPRAFAIVAALRQITGDRDRGLDLGAWLAWAAGE